MKVYSVNTENVDTVIEVGDYIYVGSDYVKVISILKVNLDENTIWFSGVTSDKLENTTVTTR